MSTPHRGRRRESGWQGHVSYSAQRRRHRVETYNRQSRFKGCDWISDSGRSADRLLPRRLSLGCRQPGGVRRNLTDRLWPLRRQIAERVSGIRETPASSGWAGRSTDAARVSRRPARRCPRTWRSPVMARTARRASAVPFIAVEPDATDAAVERTPGHGVVTPTMDERAAW
jgi:hypothetical protein